MTPQPVSDWWRGAGAIAHKLWSLRHLYLKGALLAMFLTLPLIGATILQEAGMVSEDVALVGGMIVWILWMFVIIVPITIGEERRKAEGGA